MLLETVNFNFITVINAFLLLAAVPLRLLCSHQPWVDKCAVDSPESKL